MLKDKSAATDAFQILILIRKSLFRFSLSDKRIVYYEETEKVMQKTRLSINKRAAT